MMVVVMLAERQFMYQQLTLKSCNKLLTSRDIIEPVVSGLRRMKVPEHRILSSFVSWH